MGSSPSAPRGLREAGGNDRPQQSPRTQGPVHYDGKDKKNAERLFSVYYIPSLHWLAATALFCPHSPVYQVPGHSQVRQLGGLKGQPLNMFFAPRKVLCKAQEQSQSPGDLPLRAASSI